MVGKTAGGNVAHGLAVSQNGLVIRHFDREAINFRLLDDQRHEALGAGDRRICTARGDHVGDPEEPKRIRRGFGTFAYKSLRVDRVALETGDVRVGRDRVDLSGGMP